MRGWLAKALGNRGERRAARYLRSLGYTIIARQHTNRYGEVDIIARDGDCLVFVEVKTRKSVAAGHPAEAVDRAKQSQLTRVALAYLKQHGLLEARSRFDVIALIWPKDSRTPQLEHFQNAFPPVGTGQMFS
jgi:putative endonuclease